MSINRISLIWRRYADSPLLCMGTRGLPRVTLRHYAQRASFKEFRGDDGDPVFVGTIEQREGLLCELENAGYEIEEDYR